ncbi:MAG TPA: 2Fe-2S iron-sulfur cluster-binding protein [Kofleriaceae bacterium]|nr:2Fe-2S iron-sulfur cluster-binding protein [Kofleriaceae bacterium]
MPKIRYVNADGRGGEITIEAEPGTSILHAAESVDPEPRVGSACGGNCACSTCHVWILEGEDSLSPKEDAEEDRLDMAFDVRPESRLGCQALLGEEDVVVEITPESHRAWLDEHPEVRRKAG